MSLLSLLAHYVVAFLFSLEHNVLQWSAPGECSSEVIPLERCSVGHAAGMAMSLGPQGRRRVLGLERGLTCNGLHSLECLQLSTAKQKVAPLFFFNFRNNFFTTRSVLTIFGTCNTEVNIFCQLRNYVFYRQVAMAT